MNTSVQLLVNSRYSVTDIRAAKLVADIVHDHADISADVTLYNKFWSKYAAINYFTFIPLECFVLYITLFVKVEPLIWLTFFVLSLYCGAILGIVVLSGAMVSVEVRLTMSCMSSIVTST